MTQVTLVDTGCGNMASVRFAFERLGVHVQNANTCAEIENAERLVLPGVGSAAFAMTRIRELGIEHALREFPRPFLGICLGMQLLFTVSEERNAQCLNKIPGSIRKLAPATDRPVPHMGWSQISLQPQNPLFSSLPDNPFMYFVHSFAAPVTTECIAACNYGAEFAAVVQSGNFYGCQFHPERSGRTGALLLDNFLRLPC